MKRWIMGALAVLAPLSAWATEPGLEALQTPSRTLMLIEPETVDRSVPDAGAVSDCGGTTWLTDAGKAKARRIGQRLRAAGLDKAPVFTSPSCAAVEAGIDLGLGKVSIQPLLQDLLKTRLTRSRQRQEFGLFLADYYGGPPFVLVTHRNNVLDLSELYLAPGDGIILAIDLNGDVPSVLGSARFR